MLTILMADDKKVEKLIEEKFMTQEKFSKDIDVKFNKLLDETFGVGRFKKFSPATARQRGKGKGRFNVFLPPSAEDNLNDPNILVLRVIFADDQAFWSL